MLNICFYYLTSIPLSSSQKKKPGSVYSKYISLLTVSLFFLSALLSNVLPCIDYFWCIFLGARQFSCIQQSEAKCSSVPEFLVIGDGWRFMRDLRDKRCLFPNSGHTSGALITNLFIHILHLYICVSVQRLISF